MTMCSAFVLVLRYFRQAHILQYWTPAVNTIQTVGPNMHMELLIMHL